MLMFLYVLLMVVTTIYLVSSAKMDIRERQVYTLPCFFLTLSWGLYILNMEVFIWQELVLYWLLIHVVWRLFNHFKVWGEGDSDVFLLLSNIVLATLWQNNWIVILIGVCICLISSLAMAILISIFEFEEKELSIGLDSKVAVVPGFAVVMIFLMIIGFVGRLV